MSKTNISFRFSVNCKVQLELYFLQGESRRSGSGRQRSNHHQQTSSQMYHHQQMAAGQVQPQHQQRRKYQHQQQQAMAQGQGVHPAAGGGRAQPVVAPTTGEIRSGHIEVDSLYGGAGGQLTVNAMNAPNNSTMQCGCENIDCPFCNLMMSVQMSS